MGSARPDNGHGSLSGSKDLRRLVTASQNRRNAAGLPPHGSLSRATPTIRAGLNCKEQKCLPHLPSGGAQSARITSE